MNACLHPALPVRPSLGSSSLDPTRSLIIGVVGPGQVGQALLDQVRAAQGPLRQRRGLDLRLAAVANRRQLWLDCDDPALNRQPGPTKIWRPHDWSSFVSHVRASGSPAVVVDCSACDTLPDHYAAWLASGVHVVTPNKRAGSGSRERREAIHAAARRGGGQFRYEATVGAGLPVIQTLRDLRDTGDELHGIDGLLSGTLAWLCHQHRGDLPFSDLVRHAHALGYTEPDPRDDLSGQDVARKLVILAREAGWDMSLEDVDVESLVPEALTHVPLSEFLERLNELDEGMAQALQAAHREQSVLRHVASLDRSSRACVRLKAVPLTDALAHGRHTDNVIQFRTRRYADTPLVIQGPGAGPEVTAAGIFADLLRLREVSPSKPGWIG